jgi:hypothetical protein
MGYSSKWGGLAVVGFLIGCGGSTPASEAPSGANAAGLSAPATPSQPASATPSAPAAPATDAVPTVPPASVAATDAKYDDPGEHPDGHEMEPLFTKAKKPTFPKKTVNDRDCWASLGVSGQHDKDYQTIVNACGTPAGLVEYAKPVLGRLHHKHDPRDVYKLKLLGGYCYRYFAVADSGINDLDVLIQKPGGALVGDDKTSSPIAIIESDQPWCLDDDQTLEFHVKVDGVGTGGYVFGVWARPKGK